MKNDQKILACPYCHKSDKLDQAAINYARFLDGTEQHCCARCGFGFGYHPERGSFK